MKQLASASVKCAVSEENKEILKRSLCRELDLDFTQWDDNTIVFKKKSFSRIYDIQINIDVLPDMKGFSFWAQSTKDHTPWLEWLFIALIGGCVLLFISAFLVFAIHRVIYRMESEIFVLAILIVGGVLSFISDSFNNWYNDFRIKSQLDQAFKQTVNTCDKE